MRQGRDIETTSGRDGFVSRVIISSRQITSDAIDDPPGLSTRSTIALMESSSRDAPDLLDHRVRSDDGRR